MDVSLIEDVTEFAALAAPVLAADPVRHTITLTALDAVRRGGAAVDRMLVARESGRVEGVALRSPGRAVLVEALPVRFAPALAEVLARVDEYGSGGVTGPVPAAGVFARPVLAGMSRIGPVYTPPEHRRHGYAAAVTAAASRWALDAGAAQVLLFTDLDNPTTNALYPRIGYRPLHDMVELRLVRG